MNTNIQHRKLAAILLLVAAVGFNRALGAGPGLENDPSIVEAAALQEYRDWLSYGERFRMARMRAGDAVDWSNFRTQFDVHVAHYAKLDILAARADEYLTALERYAPGTSGPIWREFSHSSSQPLREAAEFHFMIMDFQAAVASSGKTLDAGPFEARFDALVGEYPGQTMLYDQAKKFLSSLERVIPGSEAKEWMHLAATASPMMHDVAGAELNILPLCLEMRSDKPDARAARDKIDALVAHYPKAAAEQIYQLETNYLGMLERTDAVAYEVQLHHLMVGSDPKLRDYAAKQFSELETWHVPLEMKFTAVDGRAVDLAKLRGKVVLIDFWATWCQPCTEELPNVKRVYEMYQDKGFEVVGISFDHQKDRQKFIDYCSKYEVTWPQDFEGMGAKNRFALEYGVETIPVTFLLDRQGRIVATDLRGEQLETAVKKLL